jgi:hypothetical protein
MITPRTREGASRHHLESEFAAVRRSLAALQGHGGETKTAGGQTYDWVNQACGMANAMQNSGCSPNGGMGGCQPVQIGIPQGAAAGVVATTATGTFTLTAPAKIVPYQLILHGLAIGFQVTNLTAGLMGPLIAGLATSPIGGDAFAASVNEAVPLKAIWIDAGVTITLTLVNPTLGNLTFVGSLKCVMA